MKFAIIYGSVRTGRQGIKAAKFMEQKLKARKHTTILVDPKVHKLPLLNKMYKEYPKGKAPKNLEKLHKIFNSVDGYLIVTAEYNHSMPPALTNMINYFMPEYFFKPSGIVCYSAGSFGGVRALIQARSFLAEVGMSSIPSFFPIGKVQDAFDDKGNAMDKAYDRRVVKFLDEFEWYAKALKEARKKGKPY